MALLTDAQELHALFDQKSNNVDINKYNKVEWTRITDVGSTPQVVVFDNQGVMNLNTTLHDAYLELVLNVARDGTTVPPTQSYVGMTCSLAGTTATFSHPIATADMTNSTLIIGSFNAGAITAPAGLTCTVANTGTQAATTFTIVPLATTAYNSAGNGINATRQFGCRVSTAELVNGIQFSLASGQTILNEEHSLPLINTFRKLTRYNRLGLEQKAVEIQYAPDEFPNKYTLNTAPTPLRDIQAIIVPNSIVTSVEDYNPGFVKRCAYRKIHTQPDSNTGTGTVQVTFFIPLSELHDFFAQVKNPWTNVRWQLRFSLSQPMNTTSIFYPFIAPLLDLPSGVTFTPGTAKLHIKSVTMEKEDTDRFVSALTSGLTKHIAFAETQYIKVQSNYGGAGDTFMVTNSITGVERVIIFAVPAGHLLSGVAPFLPTVELPKCEIKINNTQEKFFLPNNNAYVSGNAVVGRRERYDVLKEQLYGGGNSDIESSPINYFSYMQGGQFYYVFDFSRRGLRPDAMTAVQIQVEIAGANSTIGKDIYALIERKTFVDLSVDTNNVTVIKRYQ
jgi:hypothetical protein